jgi:PASTA domain
VDPKPFCLGLIHFFPTVCSKKEKYMKRMIAAFAAVAAVAWPAAVFTCAGVAHADDYTYVPLAANRDVFPGPNGASDAMIVSTPVSVKRGEMVRVTGQLAVSVPGGHSWPEVDLAVICFDQSGHAIPGQPGFGSGTNIGGGAFQWNADILLVAPPITNALTSLPANNNGGSVLQTPLVYYCGVMVTHVDYQTTVLAPAPGQTTHGTLLGVSSIPDPGAQQWFWSPPQGYCPTGDKNASGPSNCVYLGGRNPNSMAIFQNTWQASNDATVVDFVATGQNTVCFQYSGSCREIDESSGGSSSSITSYLKIQQLDQNSNPCGAATVAYSENTVKGDAETDTTETLNVSKDQHHLPVYYHATVPVSQVCGGSRAFATSLYTQLVGGDPIKFENKSLNAINLERTATTTVPPVIGLTLQAATAAIVAAGLYTGAPNNVMSTDPPGTVLAQNSPARTVEPVGSQVQITVSAGQTSVPDVLGASMPAAEQSIKNAGLAPVALPPINNCADESAQGKVQTQSPLRGTQVSLGAQVEIRTISCNR